MRKAIPCVSLCILLSAAGIRAEGFNLDLYGDGALLLGGLGAAVAGEVLLNPAPLPLPSTGDPSAVNPFDGLAVFPYSEGLDITGGFLQYTGAAAPLALCFFLPLESSLEIGVVYAETLSWTFFVKNMIKYLMPRNRPYTYTALLPAAGSGAADWNRSFPSGHTAMAFAAATCGLVIFDEYFPSSPYFWPFAIGSYALAGCTAASRVLSGMHFLTDVVAGALIGTACGFFIPFIHIDAEEKPGSNAVSLLVYPDGIAVRLEL